MACGFLKGLGATFKNPRITQRSEGYPIGSFGNPKGLKGSPKDTKGFPKCPRNTIMV